MATKAEASARRARLGGRLAQLFACGYELHEPARASASVFAAGTGLLDCVPRRARAAKTLGESYAGFVTGKLARFEGLAVALDRGDVATSGWPRESGGRSDERDVLEGTSAREARRPRGRAPAVAATRCTWPISATRWFEATHAAA